MMPAVKEGRETLQHRRQLHLPYFPPSETIWWWRRNSFNPCSPHWHMLKSPHGSKEEVETFASDGHVLSKKIFVAKRNCFGLSMVPTFLPPFLFLSFPSFLLLSCSFRSESVLLAALLVRTYRGAATTADDN